MNKDFTNIIFKLKNNKLTLSVAESCTGGMLAQAITSIDGASKIFKFGIVTQAIFVLSICLFGVITLLPGIFSDNLHKKTLSKYASGYNLYNWANSILPEDSVTLISHRSYYFAEKNIIYFGMSNFLNKTNINYHLKKIKEKKIQLFVCYKP